MNNVFTKFPYDGTGTNVNNRLNNFPFTLPENHNGIVTLKYGTFYTDGFEIREDGVLLNLIDDYKLAHVNSEVQDLTGIEACAVIILKNPKADVEYTVTCQLAGGLHAFTSVMLEELVTALEFDYDSVNWHNISGLPTEFVPSDHLHLLKDIVGMEHLVHGVLGIRDAVLIGKEQDRLYFMAEIDKKLNAEDLTSTRIWDLFTTKRAEGQSLDSDTLKGVGISSLMRSDSNLTLPYSYTLAAPGRGLEFRSGPHSGLNRTESNSLTPGYNVAGLTQRNNVHLDIAKGFSIGKNGAVKWSFSDLNDVMYSDANLEFSHDKVLRWELPTGKANLYVNATGWILNRIGTGGNPTTSYTLDHSGEIRHNSGFKFWSEANDGAGSGLDSDLLDGLQSLQFLRSDVDDIVYGHMDFRNGLNVNTNTGTEPLRISRGNSATAEYCDIWVEDAYTVFKHVGDELGEGRFIFRGVTPNLGQTTLLNFDTSKIHYKSHEIYHQGNDGSGSGLDADLWDGHQFDTYLNQGVRTGDNPSFQGLSVTGFDFVLGNGDQSSRGNSGSSRALVKTANSTLTINHAKDFTGGVHVGSNMSIHEDLIVGSPTYNGDRVIRVLADDAHKAGFEAYGATQGTGYLYVGQGPSHGGGISYNGDGTPSFASGEINDEVCFYRRSANSNVVVFGYKYDSSKVTFRADVEINGLVTLNDTVNFAGASRYWLSTSNNWGLYWNSTSKTLELKGAGNTRTSFDLNTGNINTVGNVTSDKFLMAKRLFISQTSGLGEGLSLYGDDTSAGLKGYGISLARTDTFNAHGVVQSDWATYFTMTGSNGRGWIFRNQTSETNVASINNLGSMELNGHIVVGGSTGSSTFKSDLWMAPGVSGYSNAIIFQNDSGSTGEVGIRAHDDGLEIYEPEDGSKRWLWISDDVNGVSDIRLGTAGSLVWASHNDGAGSGLDADLWDGHQFDSYLNQSVRIADSPTFKDLSLTGDLKMVGTDSMIWTPNTSSGYTGFYDPYNAKYVLRYTNGVGFGLGGLPTSGRVLHIQSGGLGDIQSDVRYFANLDGEMMSLGNGADADKWISIGNVGQSASWKILFQGSTGGASGNEIGFKSNWNDNSLLLDHEGHLDLTIGSSTYAVYHQGNDGSGSGLDSDLLDGLQASQFLRSDLTDVAYGHIQFRGGVTMTSNLTIDGGRDIVFNGVTRLDVTNGSTLSIRDTGSGNEFLSTPNGGRLILGGSSPTNPMGNHVDFNNNIRVANGHGMGTESNNVLQFQTVGGGSLGGLGGSITGSMRIVLPSGWSNSMVTFTVDLFNYAKNTTSSIQISGYVHETSKWIYTTATSNNSSGDQPVITFNSFGGKPALWIGLPSQQWSYPHVSIRDVSISGSGLNYKTWVDGWALAVDTVGTSGGYSFQVRPKSVATQVHANLGLETASDIDLISATNVADNDGFRIRLQNGSNNGTVFFDVNDDGNEEFHFRQFIGGGRDYIGTPRTLKLMDSAGDTTLYRNLYVPGDFRLSGDMGELSDRTMKRDIKPIVDPLAFYRQSNGYTYSMRKTGRKTLGIIAQELAVHYPELIDETDDGKLQVIHRGLHGIHTAAIKSLDQTTCNLSSTNAKLNDRIKALEAKNESMEKMITELTSSNQELMETVKLMMDKLES